MDFGSSKNKKIVAKSKATYRGVQIMEDENGRCVVFLSGRRHDCANLGEATAMIDAAYAMVGLMLAPGHVYTGPG